MVVSEFRTYTTILPLAAMTAFKPYSGFSPSAVVQGLGLMLLSAMLFVLSWPAVGGMWFMLMIAFVPLFWLQKLCMAGEITQRQLIWFASGAFFLWNSGALYFLLFIDDHPGMRLLVLLTPVMINTLWMAFTIFLLHRASLKWGSVFGHVLFVMCWLIFEYMQHHWTLAFPWLTLGNVLGPHPAWMQWYALTGVGGGSLWILLVNVLMFRVFVSQAAVRKSQWLVAVVLAVVLIIPPTSNLWLKADNGYSGDKVRYTIVQPCLRNSDQKFEMLEQMKSVQAMLHEAGAVSDQPAVVVFPETAIFDPGRIQGSPSNLQYTGIWVNNPQGSEVLQAVRNAQRDKNWPAVITGAFASKLYLKGEAAPAYAHQIPEIGAHVEHYNSAAIISAETVQFRHKTILVAGVERIPFVDVFPFLNNLAVDFGGVVGTLGRAEEVEAVQVANHTAGVQICYDSAFGWLSRKQAWLGAEVLVVLTNDSWWDDTPGYQQLLSFAQIRAIETGKPLVRCANNGVSGFISPTGEITDFLPWNETGAISAEITLNDRQTFYTRFGDWIYIGAILLLPILIVIAYVANRIKQSKHGERLT